MNKTLTPLLEELKAGLSEEYGDHLVNVYLFGSRVRGEEDKESDVDVLVILDDIAQYGAEVDRTSKLVSDVSLNYGVSISVVFVREKEWLEGDTPFLQNVREEAVPV